MAKKQKVQPWHQKVADMYGFTVNKEFEECILEGLEAKKAKFGARYCPCKVDNVVSNVCPCVEMRTDGHCHCGLFVRE